MRRRSPRNATARARSTGLRATAGRRRRESCRSPGRPAQHSRPRHRPRRYDRAVPPRTSALARLATRLANRLFSFPGSLSPAATISSAAPARIDWPDDVRTGRLAHRTRCRRGAGPARTRPARQRRGRSAHPGARPPRRLRDQRPARPGADPARPDQRARARRSLGRARRGPDRAAGRLSRHGAVRRPAQAQIPAQGACLADRRERGKRGAGDGRPARCVYQERGRRGDRPAGGGRGRGADRARSRLRPALFRIGRRRRRWRGHPGRRGGRRRAGRGGRRTAQGFGQRSAGHSPRQPDDRPRRRDPRLRHPSRAVSGPAAGALPL